MKPQHIRKRLVEQIKKQSIVNTPIPSTKLQALIKGLKLTSLTKRK
jgi:hypothetical protein